MTGGRERDEGTERARRKERKKKKKKRKRSADAIGNRAETPVLVLLPVPGPCHWSLSLVLVLVLVPVRRCTALRVGCDGGGDERRTTEYYRRIVSFRKLMHCMYTVTVTEQATHLHGRRARERPRFVEWTGMEERRR